MLLLTGIAAVGVCGEPFIERVDLFHADTDGYKLYRIPGIVVTRRGTVLAYCEARKRQGSDWATIDIMAARTGVEHGDRGER